MVLDRLCHDIKNKFKKNKNKYIYIYIYIILIYFKIKNILKNNQYNHIKYYFN